jgi:PKD repeat protein
VPKVATQLLAFFKTDPTATPWFLKTNTPGGPTCAPTASTTNGFTPLTVTFLANVTNGSAPLHDGKWTFDDGEFATNANPVKVFRTPGVYHARFTVTDTNGNTARDSVTIKVRGKFDYWRANKFTGTEFASLQISGPSANPDGDKYPNLLEYAMGLEPKTADPAGMVAASFSNDVFTLTFPHSKFADDAPLTLEATSDFITWSSVALTTAQDFGASEQLILQETISTNAPRFFRLKSELLPSQP